MGPIRLETIENLNVDTTMTMQPPQAYTPSQVTKAVNDAEEASTSVEDMLTYLYQHHDFAIQSFNKTDLDDSERRMAVLSIENDDGTKILHHPRRGSDE